MDYLIGIFSAMGSLIRTFNFYDVIDIAIVSFLVYHLVKLIRDSQSGQLIKGILIILAAYFLSCQLHFKMVSTLLSNFFQFSIFALLVVFQPELRRALEHLGRSDFRHYWPMVGMRKDEDDYTKTYKELIKITSSAVLSLSEERMGALIVFERNTRLGEVISTGTIIKSAPSVALMCNIFFNKAPLHDGALIIRNGILYAGGCILPLTNSRTLSLDLGTRHRAAVGISENSDAVAVVVSEETGRISIAVNGKLKIYDDITLFQHDLEKILLHKKKKDSYKGVISSLGKGASHD